MQMSDVKEEGGEVQSGDAGVEGVEGCVFERVRRGCCILTVFGSEMVRAIEESLPGGVFMEGVVDFYRDVFYFIFIRLKIVDFLFDFTFADERMDDCYRFFKE
jgi:hypothetical protein